VSGQNTRLYEFGPFRLVPAERQLLREGRPIALPPKAFDTLLTLVERSGRVVKKDELIRAVWPDTFIEENNLNQYVSLLRKTLAGGDGGGRYIETVRGYGYRFTAAVRETGGGAGELWVRRRTRTSVVVREEAREDGRAAPFVSGPDPSAGSRPSPHRRRSFLGAVVTALILAGAAAAFLLRGPRQPPTPAPAIRTLAVLPFNSLGAGGEEEFLGLGLADVLITKLGKTGRIGVRPTSAIQKYRSGGRDPLAIGRELNVDAVLDGRVQRSGERVRVTIQLLDVRGGAALWAEEFDGRLADIFGVQDSISARVARAVIHDLTAEESARLGRRATENAEAYHAYLKGRYFWNRRTAEDSLKSVEYFRRAIELDPDFAPAYAGLADAYNYSPESRSEKGPRVRAALEKALALDATLAEAHATLANVSLFDDWDWPEAERRFRRAIELDPNHPTAHHWYAYYLAAMGRLDEALAEIRRAQELDPLSLIINTDVGQLLHFARRDAEAVEQLRKTIEMDPRFVMAHHRLAEVYERMGRFEEAAAEFQKAYPGHRAELPRMATVGHVYALSGKRSEARRILALIAQSFRAGGSPASKSQVALIHAGLGERDQAFAWLEQALAEKDVELILLKSNPRFDGLRSDARFQDLLRRMNLGS
jgi:TolB-like protein/DNA-binding winged helix-turn-helix (wHTH) protein/Flp pilus assembly protein TadD